MDYLQKSTRSSGATPIGCTYGAPNEIRVLKIQIADLQSINSRQNTEIGSGLKIKELRQKNEDLLRGLELYYKVIFDKLEE